MLRSTLRSLLYPKSITRNIFTIILNLFSNYVLVYFSNIQQFVCLLYMVPEEDAEWYRIQRTYKQKVIKEKSFTVVFFNKHRLEVAVIEAQTYYRKKSRKYVMKFYDHRNVLVSRAKCYFVKCGKRVHWKDYIVKRSWQEKYCGKRTYEYIVKLAGKTSWLRELN